MAGQTAIASSPVRERPRVFRVTRAAILIVATATVFTDIVQVITVSTGRSLFTTGGADGRLPLSWLPQLTQADLREGASGTLADADLFLRILGALPSLIHAVTIVLATVFLLRVLRGIAVAQPFAPFVLLSWRQLSVALLVGGVVQSVADTAAIVYLTVNLATTFQESFEARNDFLGADYQGIGTNFPQWPISILVAGLIALALTAAFRAGARLEKDVDGVV